MIKGIIKPNQTKESLIQTIYLNQEILCDIEKTRLQFEQIFGGTELRHYGRLTKWKESHEAIIDESIQRILNILEEESELLDIN